MAWVVRDNRGVRSGAKLESRDGGRDDAPGGLFWRNHMVHAGLEAREEVIGCWVLLGGGGWDDCHDAGSW